MPKPQVRGRKFQEEYKGLIWLSAIAGLYPPGFEVLVKNKYVQWAFYLLAAAMAVTANIYVWLFFTLALFTNVFTPRAFFFLYFRRAVGAGPLCSKVTFHLSRTGYGRMTKIFQTWNDVINVDFYVEKRQKILAGRLKKSLWLFAVTVFFSCGLLQVPTLIALRGRHAYGAKYAVFPHNPDEWYHWYLIALQFFDFFVANFGAVCYNIFLYVIMLMANTQLTVLQDSLRDIFYDGTKNDEDENMEQLIKSENNIKYVRMHLKRWVTVHQETISWLEEIKQLFKITSAIKFAFLGLYICLAVFTVPGYIKSGRTTELIFVIAYTVGNYCLLFYESRLADELLETSSQVCLGAYDTNWCAYPRDVRKAFLIILQNSTMKPFRVKSFGIIYDSSATFLSIMQSAYQVLSFLLQVEI